MRKRRSFVLATSRLQRYAGERLRRLFSEYGIEENIRPDWLISSQGERLELDFFIDKLSVAVEVQGKQHTKFVPHFHETEWDFEQQQRRDREKAGICKWANITLFYVFRKQDIPNILGEIDIITYRKREIPLDGIILELGTPIGEYERKECPPTRTSWPFVGKTAALRDYMQSIESGAAHHSPDKIKRRLSNYLDRIYTKNGEIRGGLQLSPEEKAIISKAWKMLPGTKPSAAVAVQ